LIFTQSNALSSSSSSVRHVGDLGNVIADASGVVHLNILNPLMSLQGEHSIVGRSIVIHAMPDDLGCGGNEESTKTGNSGARLACGSIGLTNPQTK
jgi:Cu-Zn family superoxide dismutase